MRIEFTTDAARRDTTRMTATERDNAEKTGFSLACMASVNAEMLAEGERALAEIMKGANR